MSISTYDLLAQALFLGAIDALSVAVAYLIALFIGWNSHNRKSRFVRFLVFLLSCPAMLGAQQYVQWGFVMPLLREAKTREVIQHRREQIKTTSYLSVGDVVPTFDITDANGFPFLLPPSSNKFVVVVFLATWCGPCRRELPRVEKLWNRYRDNENFDMIVIGRGESLESVGKFRTEYGYTFPVAPDLEEAAYSHFAKELIPRTYLIAPNGKILHLSVGYSSGIYGEDIDELEKMLADALDSPPVR